MEGFARAGNVRETLRYFHMFEPDFLLPMETPSVQPNPDSPTPGDDATCTFQKMQVHPLNLVIRAELESNLPESFERALQVLSQMRLAAFASKRKVEPKSKSKSKTISSMVAAAQSTTPPSRYPAPDEVCII